MKNNKCCLVLIMVILLAFSAKATDRKYDEIDVHFYELDLNFNVEDSSLNGSVNAHFTALRNDSSFTFQLFGNLHIDSVLCLGKRIFFERDSNDIKVQFRFLKGSQHTVKFYYHGKPLVAKKAPWDGGMVWSKDSLGRPFIGVACEGLGASVWWPNHDVLWDKADSISLSYTVPKGLIAVGNGKFVSKEEKDNKTSFKWKVSYPVINYNVTAYIGHFQLIEDTLMGLDGELALNHYVLDYNKEKAIRHFLPAKPMLHFYESLFGAYPFYRDGYKLVESPYLGMEHQSAIAYGNQYKMGYLGHQISAVNFDYIIIHESGHEYWGNNISMEQLGDMWIHESFCTYTEALYAEKFFGREAMEKYLRFMRANVDNKAPIIPLKMNEMGSGDMYHKGALMLEMLRRQINNDSLWFSILKGLNEEFAYQTVNTIQVVEFINQKSDYDFTAFFRWYLMRSGLPVLKIKKEKKGFYSFVWEGVPEDFSMKINVVSQENIFDFEVGSTPVRKEFKKFKVDQVQNDLSMFEVIFE